MSAVLYQDSWVVVARKNAGVPVQTRDKNQQTVLSTLRLQLDDPGLQPVHRIDQPVTGAIILARSREVFTAIHRSLVEGKVCRRYLAVVDTPPENPSGVLEDYLSSSGRPSGKNALPGEPSGGRRPTRETTGTRIVPAGHTGSRQARLTYTTVGTTDHHTILLVELETGRHHQIRAQLAHRGWHVVGDARYGTRRPMRDRSIGLHAWYLNFPHPILHHRVEIFAPLPDAPLWHGVFQGLSPEVWHQSFNASDRPPTRFDRAR
jgi:23S rRNA pseudouridine1911/1915/1917 synthase